MILLTKGAQLRVRCAGRRLNALIRPPNNLYFSGRRCFAVFAVGEGWTGALGTGRIDDSVPGHDDKYGEDEVPSLPMLIFDGKEEEDVQSISLGWGHTAIITKSKKVLITGRPHDFGSLVRLHKLRPELRNYASQASFNTSMDPHNRTDSTSLVARIIAFFVKDEKSMPTPDLPQWEIARRSAFMTTLHEFEFYENEVPKEVVCSAGLTSVLAESGKLYSLGLNRLGQCGIGKKCNNVWQFSRVVGLNSKFADEVERATVRQSHPVQSLSLGLQHGICLNSIGEMFAWGKGDRGQLGQERLREDSEYGLPIRKACSIDENLELSFFPMNPVKQVAAGMIHSAALTTDNRVFVWGKNILPDDPNVDKKLVKNKNDSKIPVLVNGLPTHSKVERISCGSHHTSLLLEDGSVWALGLATDTKERFYEPIMLIPPGIVNLPVRQFAAHMDRTTIVGADGRQVLQVQLWQDPEMQESAIFTPKWVDDLLEQDPDTKIREVHRGFVHSVCVTE